VTRSSLSVISLLSDDFGWVNAQSIEVTAGYII